MKKVFFGSIVSILLGAGMLDYFGVSVLGIVLFILGCVVAIFSGTSLLYED